ncbi:DNA helicase MCM9 isoform X1 [Babesia caballi]|uniref:DNA helicase MCM9 isoform X1 n=1 Tax=Babesia caballi TaxID=5871 RepID=A0AAV4LZ06_BABCB|nr:DNA helicase MCM9 isoform X1 [Babesia caballi]
MSDNTRERTFYGRRGYQKRDSSFRDQVAADAGSEQLYFPECGLPPFGYQEDTALRRSERICDMLDTPLSYYVNGFIQYFISDAESLSQYVNMLSVDHYVDLLLRKKIALCSSSKETLGLSDVDSPHRLSASWKRVASVSPFISPRSSATSDSAAGTPSASHASQESSAARSNGSYGETALYANDDWSSDRVGPTSDTISEGSLDRTTSDAGAPEDAAETSTPRNTRLGSARSFDLVSTLSSSVASETSQYSADSKYRSFFVDVTKLITEMPTLGTDLLTVPEILLSILDRKVLPMLYELLDELLKASCSTDPARILELFYEMYDCDSLCTDSDSVSKYLDKVLNRTYCKHRLDAAKGNDERASYQFTTRLRNLPPTADIWRHRIDQIREKDVGSVVALVSTVTRVGIISVLDEEREYVCTRCRQSVVARSVAELHYFIQPPTRCPHYLDSLDSMCRRQKCYGTGFVPGNALKRIDIQEIRCQSMSEDATTSSVGGAVPVVLRRDITGTCVPGDTVHMIGLVKRRWRTLRTGRRCVSEIFLDVISLDVKNTHIPPPLNPVTVVEDNIYSPFWSRHRYDEVVGRNILLGSICTTLANVENAKLGMLLTLIGGFPFCTPTFEEEESVNRWAKFTTERHLPDLSPFSGALSCSSTDDVKAARVSRTHCHLLFLGHPGTGKSQFLRYAKTLVDRHVSVSGTHCTSAGLTCSVVRDSGHAMLAAGALVLADGGLCCIDEFTLIHPDDKACLHEAMEQQVVSVAKVGIKCSLNCRCTVLAAANFKPHPGARGSGDDEGGTGALSPITPMLNIDVPIPLLSRFDLVLVFTDNALNDSELVDFLLDSCEASATETTQPGTARGKSHVEAPVECATGSSQEGGAIEPTQPEPTQPVSTTLDLDQEGSEDGMDHAANCVDWDSPNAMKEYIEYLRSHLYPTLTAEAKKVIHAYYTALRKQAIEAGNPCGPTIRTVESLIRLSQAHARLMFRDHISLFDAVSVIWVGEFGLQGYKVGAYSGQEHVVDREGLFDNLGGLMQEFCRQQEAAGLPHHFKVCNGITTMDMYQYFENILLVRLGLPCMTVCNGLVSELQVDEGDEGW